jgi:hypothetical protein
MKTSDNGGFLGRLPLFSKLSILSMYKRHFQIVVHNFSRKDVRERL